MSTDQKTSKAAAKPLLPPDEKFWEAHSKHFEFPLSTVAAIAAHVFLFAFMVFLLNWAMVGKDKKSVPIRVVAVNDGADTGDGGMEGAIGGASEGQEKVEQTTETPPTPNIIDSPPLIEPVQAVSQYIPSLRDDPDAAAQFAKNEAVENFSRMNEQIRNNLTKGMQKKSNNPAGSGKSAEGGQGDGEGGFGGTKTAKRVMRWTLRFNTRNGKDYLNQLDTMGAVLLIPQPPDYRSAKILRNLKNPDGGKEEDLAEFQQMHFTDSRPDSVKSMAEELKLDFVPPYFTAFFPKEFEEDLAKKERAYAGRKEEDILETVFEVIIRNKKPDLRVTSQTPLQRRR